MLVEMWDTLRHNLFKPLILFFYLGFSIPILGVPFEFPKAVYQGLVIYLLVAIGWHGGAELAQLSGRELGQAMMFMGVGFLTNLSIGLLAFWILRTFTKLRRIDAATVSAYYGSDSAGTFVTAVGVLTVAGIKYAAFMPVMLAVMEIPGCLVGLYIVSQLRSSGMDALGNMPGEKGYDPTAQRPASEDDHPGESSRDTVAPHKVSNAELVREVFLNPGLFLLFGGILIGWVTHAQSLHPKFAEDFLFGSMFQGLLCMFLLEMGITAARRLKDLGTAGRRFICFGLLAPNIFATLGIYVAHAFSHASGICFDIGTYALFAVLCGSASYIAVPAIQRLAIPEASPSLPLAASLGLTFTYNVTIGIHLYILVARWLIRAFPVVQTSLGG